MSKKCWSIITRLERLGFFNALEIVALLHGGVFLLNPAISNETTARLYVLTFCGVLYINALNRFFQLTYKKSDQQNSIADKTFKVSLLVGAGLLNVVVVFDEGGFIYPYFYLQLPFIIIALSYFMVKIVFPRIAIVREVLLALTVSIASYVPIVLVTSFVTGNPKGLGAATEEVYFPLIIFLLILQNAWFATFTKAYNSKENNIPTIFNWLSFAKAKQFLLSFGFLTLILMLYLLGRRPEWGVTWVSYYFVGVTLLQSLVISKASEESEHLEKLGTLSGLILFGTWLVIVVVRILLGVVS